MLILAYIPIAGEANVVKFTGLTSAKKLGVLESSNPRAYRAMRPPSEYLSDGFRVQLDFSQERRVDDARMSVQLTQRWRIGRLCRLLA